MQQCTTQRHNRLSFAVSIMIAAFAAGPGLCQTQGNSKNVSLFSQITPSQFGTDFATDCWGYTASSGREYAIICLADKTAVVEITDPTSPVIVGTVSHQFDSTGDVKVYQEYAYAANGGGGGIDIIDLTDVDNGNVSLVQRMTTGGVQWVHNIAINEDSGYLYLGIGNINNGNIVAYNLSNPEAPFVDGQYSGDRSHDLQVITYTEGPFAGREIAFSFAEGNGFDIIDVTNKGNMFLRSSRTYSNTAYCHQGWVSEDRQYLYLNDELDGIQRTTVFNISDLDDPFFVNDFSSGAFATDHNLYVRDGFIFEANYRSGLRVFDARTNPTNPPEVGFYDTFSGNGKGFDGAWSNYPFFPSGTVIVSDRSGGLFVLDVSAITGGAPVCAGSGTLIEGFGEINDFNATCGSDDSYWAAHGASLFFQIADPVAQFELIATAPVGFNGGTISVDIEASKENNNGVLSMRPLLFNYVSGEFDAMGTNALTTTDTVSNFVPPGNSADYIENGTSEVTLLIEVIQISGIPTVRTQLDEVLFNFE